MLGKKNFLCCPEFKGYQGAWNTHVTIRSSTWNPSYSQSPPFGDREIRRRREKTRVCIVSFVNFLS